MSISFDDKCVIVTIFYFNLKNRIKIVFLQDSILKKNKCLSNFLCRKTFSALRQKSIVKRLLKLFIKSGVGSGHTYVTICDEGEGGSYI